jgi:hypothetical protein
MSERHVSPQELGSSRPVYGQVQGPIHDERRASATVRAQSAVVRTLADALKQLALPGDESLGLRQQLAEELARLGSCIEEAAARDRSRNRE